MSMGVWFFLFLFLCWYLWRGWGEGNGRIVLHALFFFCVAGFVSVSSSSSNITPFISSRCVYKFLLLAVERLPLLIIDSLFPLFSFSRLTRFSFPSLPDFFIPPLISSASLHKTRRSSNMDERERESLSLYGLIA